MPKCLTPKSASDYRLITLSNVIYKIISNISTSWLNNVLDKFISPYQTSFLSSGIITDNIVLAHEVVEIVKRYKAKKGLVALKLDMSKAFDRIKWSLDNV